MSVDEQLSYSRGQGKWGQAGVPKKGWSCVDVEDLEEPTEICEMCEIREIRYVHYMTHKDYPHELRVGCVCAEHMEEDYKNPKLREKRVRSLARQKATWTSRKWYSFGGKDVYTNVSGFHVEISEYRIRERRDNEAYTVSIWNKNTRQYQRGRKVFQNLDDAKAAALKAYIWATKNLVKKP